GDWSGVLLYASRNVFGLGDVATTGQYHVERHAVCSWRSYNRLSRLWQSRRCVALAPGCYAHLLDGCVRGLDRSFYAPAPGGVADDHDRGLAYPGGQPAATVAEHLEEQFVKPGPGGEVPGGGEGQQGGGAGDAVDGPRGIDDDIGAEVFDVAGAGVPAEFDLNSGTAQFAGEERDKALERLW